VIYAVPALVALAQHCAPEIATEAMLPLIQVESGGEALSINVNHGPKVRAGSVADATDLARAYIGRGYSVDVGIAQVNSRNFRKLGLTVETAFEPCTNLRAASQILQEGYARASVRYGGIDAISATYSAYNTGSLSRGFTNGYVNKVWRAAGQTSPGDATASAEPSILGQNTSLAAGALPSLPATWATRVERHGRTSDWVVGQSDPSAVVVFR